MKDDKKIRTYIRLAPELKEKLIREKQKTGLSETAIIESALNRYFAKTEQDQLVENFLERFDEKYKNTFTRIRLAAGTADRNIQTLLNIMNTELFINGVRPEDFISMYETKHGLISESEQAVKDQIAKYKQYKDNAKVDT